MNDTTQDTTKDAAADNVIEGAITEVKPDNALVVIDPTRYATELFAPFQTELATAKRSAARKPYNIKTDAGMELAKEHRTTFVKIRTRADKAKTEAKRPIDQAGKKILEIYNALEAAAKVEEGKHNTVIVAREAEIAAEVQRKLDEQRARTEAIENRIALIRDYPATLAKADSEAIEKALAKLVEKQLLPADYDDHLEDALTAFNATVDRVREMLTEAQESEAAARKAKADADELAKLKAEAAEREKKEVEEREQRENELAQQQQQLADQQALVARQQQAMLSIQAINQSALIDGTALELHRALVDAQAIVVDADTFGGMESMAQMAKEMAITAIGTKYGARLAAELDAAHDEAISENVARSMDGKPFSATPQQLADRVAGHGYGSAYRASPAPAAPIRPRDETILEILAQHYRVSSAIALSWLADMDLEALRQKVGQ